MISVRCGADGSCTVVGQTIDPKHKLKLLLFCYCCHYFVMPLMSSLFAVMVNSGSTFFPLGSLSVSFLFLTDQNKCIDSCRCRRCRRRLSAFTFIYYSFAGSLCAFFYLLHNYCRCVVYITVEMNEGNEYINKSGANDFQFAGI